jgi:hypothetical protein
MYEFGDTSLGFHLYDSAGTLGTVFRNDGGVNYIKTGNVGIGDTSPDYPLEILDATGPQFAISDTDGVDYLTIEVDGNGDVTVVASGGDISFGDENLTTTGSVDFGGGALEIPNGTDLPATCSVGQIFQDTDDNACADAGGGDGVVCVCKSADAWAVLTDI